MLKIQNTIPQSNIRTLKNNTSKIVPQSAVTNSIQKTVTNATKTNTKNTITKTTILFIFLLQSI